MRMKTKHCPLACCFHNDLCSNERPDYDHIQGRKCAIITLFVIEDKYKSKKVFA